MKAKKGCGEFIQYYDKKLYGETEDKIVNGSCGERKMSGGIAPKKLRDRLEEENNTKLFTQPKTDNFNLSEKMKDVEKMNPSPIWKNCCSKIKPIINELIKERNRLKQRLKGYETGLTPTQRFKYKEMQKELKLTNEAYRDVCIERDELKMKLAGDDLR